MILKKYIEKQNNSIQELKGTARCAGLLLAPVEGFGPQPMLFWPAAKIFGGKKLYFMTNTFFLFRTIQRQHIHYPVRAIHYPCRTN